MEHRFTRCDLFTSRPHGAITTKPWKSLLSYNTGLCYSYQYSVEMLPKYSKFLVQHNFKCNTWEITFLDKKEYWRIINVLVDFDN